jgi:hypothetical protein
MEGAREARGAAAALHTLSNILWEENMKPIKRQAVIMPWDETAPWAALVPLTRQGTEIVPIPRQSTVVAPDDYELRAAITEEALQAHAADTAMARKVAARELDALRDALKRAERGARDVRTHLLLLQIASGELPVPQKALIKTALATLAWVLDGMVY